MSDIFSAAPVAAIDLNALLVPTSSTPLDVDFFNTRFTLLVNTINALGTQIDGYNSVVDDLVNDGLDRLNTLMGPYLTTLQQAAQLGFLVAQSGGGAEVELVQGSGADWMITEGAPLFTPTTYLLAVDNTDSTNWGLVQLESWSTTTTLLETTVVYAAKNQFSTSWTISANAAVIPAIVAMVAAAVTAQEAAVAANTSVESSLATLGDLISEISAGPVTTVCGYSGNVLLNVADIGGLVSALAAKASLAALATAISGAQPVSPILTALAALTTSANQLITATGGNGVGTIAISTVIQALLASGNAAAALTVLGALAVSNVAAPSDVATGTDNSKYLTSLATANLSPKDALITLEAGATYTFQAQDKGTVVRLSNATTVTPILPATLPVGWNCLVEQAGAGQVVFSPAAGATLLNRLNQTKIAGQYGTAGLYIWSNGSGSDAIYNLSGDTST